MIQTLQKLMTDADNLIGLPVFKQSLLNEINLIRHAVRLHLNRPLVEEDKAGITIRGNFTDGYKIYHGNTFIKSYTWQEAKEYKNAIAAAIDQAEKVVVDNATASMTLEDWARQQELMEGRLFERPDFLTHIEQRQVYVKTDAAKISKLFDTDAIRGQANHLADAFAYAVQALHNNIPFWVNLEAEQRKDKKWQRIFAALVIANMLLWWPLIFGL